MNLYLATKYQHRADAADLARRIRSMDLRVVSRWHDQRFEGEDDAVPEHELPEDVLDRIAGGNHADLARADTFCLLVRPRMQGSLVELGVALGRGMNVLIVGERRSLTPMARRERVWWCADEAACLETLARLAGRGRPLREAT